MMYHPLAQAMVTKAGSLSSRDVRGMLQSWLHPENPEIPLLLGHRGARYLSIQGARALLQLPLFQPQGSSLPTAHQMLALQLQVLEPFLSGLPISPAKTYNPVRQPPSATTALYSHRFNGPLRLVRLV
jgi:hypothetical protein